MVKNGALLLRVFFLGGFSVVTCLFLFESSVAVHFLAPTPPPRTFNQQHRLANWWCSDHLVQVIS